MKIFKHPKIAIFYTYESLSFNFYTICYFVYGYYDFNEHKDLNANPRIFSSLWSKSLINVFTTNNANFGFVSAYAVKYIKIIFLHIKLLNYDSKHISANNELTSTPNVIYIKIFFNKSFKSFSLVFLIALFINIYKSYISPLFFLFLFIYIYIYN